MANSQGTEREAFEAWVKTQIGHPFAGAFLNLMWDAWQARASRPAAEVGDLPALPTAEIPAYAGEPALYTDSQMRAYGQECARAAEARCKVSADAAIELASDTINARNAEIAELRAALAANTAIQKENN